MEGNGMLLRDDIYQAIRQSVLTCEFQPGQDLRELALADRYRVSRSPVRDALLRLERENLVTVLPRRGYRVRPISNSDVEDLFGLRLLLEPACAAAATRADAAKLQVLNRFRDFATRNHTESECVEYNESFHSAVADLAGNMRMAVIVRAMVEQFERLTRVAQCSLGYEEIQQSCEEHDAIIDAIQARDLDRAARLSYEHTKTAHERVASALASAMPASE
jgi:DNA-binding GntR family transcriptional regulator